MAEKQKPYKNIEELKSFLGENQIGALQKVIASDEEKIASLMRRIGELEARERAKLEAERREAEEANERREEAAEEKPAPIPAPAPEPAPEKREKEEPAAKAPVPAPAPEPAAPVAKAPAPAPAPVSRPAQEGQTRPVRSERSERGERSERPQGIRQGNPQGNAPYRTPSRPDRPQTAGAPYRTPRSNGDRPTYNSPRPQTGDRPFKRPNGQFGDRPPRPVGAGARPQTGFGVRGPRPVAPAPQPVPEKRREFTSPKKFEKTFVEKGPVSKRTLVRQRGATISDFDEEKSGYRKARFQKKGAKKETQTVKIDHAVVTSKEIPIKVLSEKLGISAVEIVKRLFRENIVKTVNESVDYDDAAFLALELGIDLEYKPAKTAEEELIEKHGASDAENTVPRAPIVTVMGHVDHGKTSLLDKIRSTNVTAGEAGGITQSIGAYTVSLKGGKKITFIDTPGHAAFTAMRARGAEVTDIVVLVVAGDDGIMPQTVEAIDHAKAAKVPIIVAINKMDKPQSNAEKVKQELMRYELVPEEWGGDTICVPISALTGDGIDGLLETIYLVAEMNELRCNPDRSAIGVVIEAKLDKGKGPMASVLVQNGTLKTGDNLISGTTMGRVRAMMDDQGKTVKEAGPSTAVSVLGLEDVPNAGDTIFAVDQALMKQVQEERKNREREALLAGTGKAKSIDELFGGAPDENVKELRLVIKCDVQGSVEAVKASLEKLTNEEVRVKVLHAAAGAVNESDVMLADSSKAMIVAFNVRPDSKAKALAERSKIEVRTYRIIYELIDDIEAAMNGMLPPKFQEVYLGKAEVRETFNITGVGTVAGCYVKEGKLVRGGKLRIYRDDIMIVEGNVKQLKRFKDDVKEVSFGFECGCAIEGFNDIKIGDFIECYLVEEVKKS